MMMQVLRPVLNLTPHGVASASRLLATPAGTNSTAEYQQPHPVFVPIDVGPGVVVQPQTAQGFLPYPGDGWTNVVNLPVIWPMHSVFHTDGPENERPAISGEAVSGDEPISASHQSHALGSPQPSSCSSTTGTVWLQPLQPVLWPVVRNVCEGAHMSGAEMQTFHNDVSAGDACQIFSEGLVGIPESMCACAESEAPFAPASPIDYSTAAHYTEKPRHASGSASGARRQRRSKRGGAAVARKVADAAICPEEMQELRLAVKNTEEACLRSRDPSDRCSEKEFLHDVPQLTVSWADALEEEEERSWRLCTSQVSTQDSLLDAYGDREMNVGEIAKGGLPGRLQLIHEMSSAGFLEQSDLLGDMSNIDATVAPILLALENVDGVDFRSTMDWVLNSVWSLASTKKGCRIVQKALEVASSSEQQQIAEKLHGHVHESLRSPHANHVLQKCIEIAPPEQVQFVLAELRGEGAFTARHRFGCRILQRLIEHCPHWQTDELISEVLGDTARLCRHQYGNFVIQHILQHGSAAHRHAIAEVLCDDTIRLAKHRVASHVLSCAIVHCAAEDVERLTKVVLNDAGQLADLSRRQYGSFVVREVNRAARLLKA